MEELHMSIAAQNNLEKEISSLIAEILEIDEKKITADVKFVEDLGMDSMMALEILASIEKKYKIRIPEEYLAKITSLGNIVKIAGELIGKK
jgi:acyl carrier protein